VTASGTEQRVVDWLLEPSNPTARWLALRLLLERPDDDHDVVETRREIPSSQWAAAALAGQRPDGTWERGKTSRPTLAATMYRLAALAGLGMPAGDPRATAACEFLLERTELPGEGFSMKQNAARGPHECGQGVLLYVFNHFGYGSDTRVKAAAEWLLANQMLDGGWNCSHAPKARRGTDGMIRMDHECSFDLPRHRSSLYSTMAVLKGLASTKQPPKTAIARGIEFVLEHRVHRARNSGRAIYRWPPKLEFLGGGYDGLHPLRVLAMAGARPDPRLDEALSYLESRAVEGRWPEDNMAPSPKLTGYGPTRVIPPLGRPNKWVTVHALHVLRVLRPSH
jgi:hypothetical protein